MLLRRVGVGVKRFEVCAVIAEDTGVVAVGAKRIRSTPSQGGLMDSDQGGLGDGGDGQRAWSCRGARGIGRGVGIMLHGERRSQSIGAGSGDERAQYIRRSEIVPLHIQRDDSTDWGLRCQELA